MLRRALLPKLEVWRSAPGRDPLATRLDMLAVAAPREDHCDCGAANPRC